MAGFIKKELIRASLIELGWLVGLGLCIFIGASVFLGIDIRNGTADLQLYDTYLVYSAATFLAFVFFLFTFSTYSIRAVRQRFSKPLLNGILLASGLLLLVSVAVINKYLLTEAVPLGYVVYPPLAAIPNVPAGSEEVFRLITRVTYALFACQFLLVATLLYAAFQWGRSTKQR